MSPERGLFRDLLLGPFLLSSWFFDLRTFFRGVRSVDSGRFDRNEQTDRPRADHDDSRRTKARIRVTTGKASAKHRIGRSRCRGRLPWPYHDAVDAIGFPAGTRDGRTAFGRDRVFGKRSVITSGRPRSAGKTYQHGGGGVRVRPGKKSPWGTRARCKSS